MLKSVQGQLEGPLLGHREVDQLLHRAQHGAVGSLRLIPQLASEVAGFSTGAERDSGKKKKKGTKKGGKKEEIKRKKAISF